MLTKLLRLFGHGLIWGLWLGLAVSAMIQMLTWAGLGLSHLTWILTYVLVIVFTILSGRSLHRQRNARPALVQVAFTLVPMIFVSRLIYQTYMYFYITYVDPDWVDTVAIVWEAQMRDSGTTEELITKSIEDFRRQWETDFIFSFAGIASYGIAQYGLGLIVAGIGGLIARRQKS